MMSRTKYQTHPYCQFPWNMRALLGSHFLFGFFNSDLHALHWQSIYGKKCHKRSNVHRGKTIMRRLRPSCMLPIETAAHYQTHAVLYFFVIWVAFYMIRTGEPVQMAGIVQLGHLLHSAMASWFQWVLMGKILNVLIILTPSISRFDECVLCSDKTSEHDYI